MNMVCCSSRFHLSLFLLTTSFLATHQTETINTSQTINDGRNDTIISASGVFALGFFSPGNSKNRYVGIWYNKIKEKTIVWIANKDDPLTDRSGSFRVIQPGRFVLVNATNATIWSTNTSTGLQNPIARLLDSGNLVITDQNSNNFIWQSFDYPTDTFLSGMKLGWNYKTGHEVYITSGKTKDNPTSGDFTYHCDPTGYPQNIIKEGSSIRYKTGPWNGVRFSGGGNLENNSIFTYGLVQDKDEVYYHYELANDTVLMRFTLSESGVGQRWLWSYEREKWILYLAIPLDDCDVYGECGAYHICNVRSSPVCSCLDKFEANDSRGWMSGDFSNVCVRRTPLNCRNGDVFSKYSGVKLPDTERSWYNDSMTIQECKVACSKNCSCTAYASLDVRNGGSGCLLWFVDLVNMKRTYPGQDIYIRVSSELGSGSKKREMVIVMVTLSVVTGVLLLSLSMFLYYKRRKKVNLQQQETGRMRQNCLSKRCEERHEELELPMFEFSTIIKATDDFAFYNKLGEGGFGAVYKGLLGEGQQIAVKRLSRTSLQGADEFKNEVMCIARLQHRNLVKLLGCCIQGEERILVYEHMENRSLDLILFDEVKSKILDWPRRFSIINGIARGVMYLHQDSRLRVIHRDLKAGNILLDSEMTPKISDFGLARTFGGNETGANTKHVMGTYGYMSPEYAGNGLFSVKSDVFSFGVIVLEIVIGKRNKEFSYRDQSFSLLGYAWMLHREEKSLELFDSCLRNLCNVSQVLRSIHVGLLCVQEHPDDRPTMSSVVLMLNNDGVLPEPEYPGFFTHRDMLEAKISGSAAITTSLLLEGR